MRPSKPNPCRFAAPLFYGYLPFATACLWLYAAGIVHQMAKMPPPTLSFEIGALVVTGAIAGSLFAAYRGWADFVRGDYYVDLALWRDR